MNFLDIYSEKNIFVIENVFSEELCQELIEFLDEMIETPHIQTEKWGDSYNVQCKFINFNNIPAQEYRERYMSLDRKIFQTIDELSILLHRHIPFYTAMGDSGYCLRKIHGATRVHQDGIYDNSKQIVTRLIRSMSVIVALNDDYQEGIFNFPVQNVQVHLKKGMAVCFPPYWTHPHEVSAPVGHRYTINTWFYQKQNV